MSLNDRSSVASARLATVALALALLFAACATPPTPAPLPERPPAPTTDLAFDNGVDYAVDDLLIQVQRLPAFNPPPKSSGGIAGLGKKEDAPPPRGVIAVDPVIDGTTGQQTASSRSLDNRLLQRASAKFTQFDVVPVSAASLGQAQYLLVGTLSLIAVANSASGSFRINLSLTDIKTGFVVAQSAARVRGDAVDTTPTAFYRDSPSLTKDRIVEGQIRTAEAPTGAQADEIYLSRLSITALINEGAKLYESGDYAQALRHYESAAERPEGQQLRVLNGIYLANIQLGRADGAERAFARIVALGLATNSLSVKFLFRPGSLEFLVDAKANTPYDMWLRTIARGIASSTACLTIVGHTSKTGTEQLNDRLSTQRAVAIQRRIEALAPETAVRLKSVGMGFRENLVGSGTDDLRDALDRRVSFTIRDCRA
ncbi:MAG: OmpA family protein [Betaproteobacteria bacterium]